MSGGGGLFDPPPVHRNAPAGTSETGAPVAARRRSERAERVLAGFAAVGVYGFTDEEAQVGFGLRGNTYRPLRGALVKEGRLVRTDRRRETGQGGMAAVYVLAADAHDATDLREFWHACNDFPFDAGQLEAAIDDGRVRATTDRYGVRRVVVADVELLAALGGVT